MIELITENQLDEWVRGNGQIAQGLVVELISRLIAGACLAPREKRFPLGDRNNRGRFYLIDVQGSA